MSSAGLQIFPTIKQDCTATNVLGGQSRSQHILWFKVAANSGVGRGPLSKATSRRCSLPPSAPATWQKEGTVFRCWPDDQGWHAAVQVTHGISGIHYKCSLHPANLMIDFLLSQLSIYMTDSFGMQALSCFLRNVMRSQAPYVS